MLPVKIPKTTLNLLDHFNLKLHTAGKETLDVKYYSSPNLVADWALNILGTTSKTNDGID